MSIKLDIFTFYYPRSNLLPLMGTIVKVGFPAFFGQHCSVSVCVLEAAPPEQQRRSRLRMYAHAETGVITPTPPNRTVWATLEGPP